MRLSLLVRRGLSWHLRSWLAVMLACAVTTAVITGALLVGDSVRGSLRERALERLAGVRTALLSPRFFREELADTLLQAPEFEGQRLSLPPIVPAILTRGSIVHAESRRRAGDVQLIGVDDSFLAHFAPGVDWQLEGARVVLNETLAGDLGAREGETLLLSFEVISEVSREQALGDRADALARRRVDVEATCPDEGVGLFDLRHQQTSPRNLFVSRTWLARALEQTGRVNALLTTVSADQLTPAIRDAWSLDDLGLELRLDADRGYVSVESRGFLLEDRTVLSVHRVAEKLGAERLDVLTYLANRIDCAGHSIPYSIVAAVGAWQLPSGETRPVFAAQGLQPEAWLPGGAIASQWVLDDIEAATGARPPPGAPVEIGYYLVGAQHELVEKSASLVLRGSVPLTGSAADPRWTPKYPGVTDARTFGDWDPPFPVDSQRIREPGPDGEFWNEHSTTPKLYMALEDGERLWAGRFGKRTSIRIRRPQGTEPAADEAWVESLRGELRETIDISAYGFVARDLPAEVLRAVRAGTDFSMLFVSMSFFLIVAALMLAAMTYRLAIERRVRELGLLEAVGFSTRQVRSVWMREGLFVALLGVVVGSALGVGYAALLIAGLKTWWKDAVNAPFLSLHVGLPSLFIGAGVTLALVALSIWLVLRRLVRIAPRRLLAGETEEAVATARTSTGRLAQWIGIAALLLAVGIAAVTWLGRIPAALGFVLMGMLLLVGGLALFSRSLRRPIARHLSGRGWVTLLRLGARNARRAAGRSTLTVGLIAFATFLIVTVAANRRDPVGDRIDKASGNGGIALLATSTSPLYVPLDTEDGQEKLALRPDTIELIDDAVVFAFRERAGDETSCLNLYGPQEPRLLGASSEFIERAGFAWSGSMASEEAEHENPLRLLEARHDDWPEGCVPAIGDANTVTYILHSGVGETIEVSDGRGGKLQLLIVALAARSLFQGALVISEADFLEHFGSSPGWSTFFFEAPADGVSRLATELEADLGEYGFDARTSGEYLASFQAVENTYLSTFFVLGGLGLLLGTLGLGAALLRNVYERRGELALLRSIGYRRRDVAWIVLSETLCLLLVGEFLGGGSALLAVALSTAAGPSSVPWALLLGALAAIVIVGLTAATWALARALRVPLLPALRAE